MRRGCVCGRRCPSCRGDRFLRVPCFKTSTPNTTGGQIQNNFQIQLSSKYCNYVPTRHDTQACHAHYVPCRRVSYYNSLFRCLEVTTIIFYNLSWCSQIKKKNSLILATSTMSTRLLKLIEGVRFHTKGSSKGRVYLSDLMDYYARLKEGKIKNGRDSNEDIYENVLSMMMSRVLRFQKGPSYDESD